MQRLQYISPCSLPICNTYPKTDASPSFRRLKSFYQVQMLPVSATHNWCLRVFEHIDSSFSCECLSFQHSLQKGLYISVVCLWCTMNRYSGQNSNNIFFKKQKKNSSRLAILYGCDYPYESWNRQEYFTSLLCISQTVRPINSIPLIIASSLRAPGLLRSSEMLTSSRWNQALLRIGWSVGLPLRKWEPQKKGDFISQEFSGNIVRAASDEEAVQGRFKWERRLVLFLLLPSVEGRQEWKRL